jgi:hypothetical protein
LPSQNVVGNNAGNLKRALLRGYELSQTWTSSLPLREESSEIVLTLRDPVDTLLLLNHRYLLVGLGGMAMPFHIYEIRNDQLNPTPIFVHEERSRILPGATMTDSVYESMEPHFWTIEESGTGYRWSLSQLATCVL